MAIEIQRLVSTYEADISPFEKAVRQLPKISDKALTDVTNKAKVQAKAQEIVQKTMADASIREQKRATSAIVAEFNRRQKEIEKAQKQAANTSKSVFSSAFEGGFAGSFVDSFIGQLQRIPAKVSEVMNEAVKISSERINAMKGLESIADFKGIDPAKAQDAVRNLRLVKAGVVDVGEATTALKNLLAIGFSLPEAVKLLEAFSDAAAFGKQSALGYGEAIRGATEGLKNGNSILVDNVGITKNLSVILEEQGKSQKDVMNITSDASVRQAIFNGLLKEAQANIGDADKLTQGYTGAVNALDTAYKGLYAAGGDLITQSPEIIAGYKIQKEQINELTDQLKNQNSETAKTAKAWLTFYAKVTAGTYPFLSAVSNGFMVTLHTVAGVGAGIAGTVAAVIETILTTTIGSLEFVYNQAAKIVNKISGLIDQTAPGTFSMLPGGNAIEGLRGIKLEERQWNKVGTVSDKAFEDMLKSFESVNTYAGKMTQSVREMRGAIADVATYSEIVREDAKKAKEDAEAKRKTGKKPIADSNSGSSDKKGKKDKSVRDENGAKLMTWRDLSTFATDLGFRVTGKNEKTGHNKGSKHYQGLAIDVGTKEKSANEIAFIKEKAREKGIRVIDERVRPKGQKVWSAPHLHMEDARLSGGRQDKYSDDYERFLVKQSKEATQAAKDLMTRQAEAVTMAFGGFGSSELIKAVTEVRNRELEKQGKEQVSEQDIAREFERNRAAKMGQISTSGANIGRSIALTPTLDEQYLSNFRESLNLQERYNALIMSERNLEGQIASLQEEYDLGLKESIQSVQVEHRMFSQRNLALESAVGLAQQQNTQYRDLINIQVELDTLRLAGGNQAFISDRRYLASRQEYLDLTREQISLEDQIVNFRKNSAERIQNNELRERLDLLQKEEEAYSRLSKLNVLDSNAVRVRTAEFLANQPSFTDIVSEAQIGVIQGAFDMVDAGFNSIAESLGVADTAAGKFFTNLLSQLAKLALNQLFQNLFNINSGNQQQSSGGGFWSKLLGIGIQVAGSALGGAAAGGASAGSAASTFGNGSSFNSVLSAVGGGGKFFNLAGARAEGGIVKAGKNYLVGERGMEVFTPSTSGYITSNKDLQKMSGSGVTINMPVTMIANPQTGKFDSASADQAMRQLAARMKQAVERG